MLIDATEVESVLKDCLWSEADPMPPTEELPLYHGILTTYSFDPNKVEKHREQITKWLEALPKAFHLTGGGGTSFLAGCVDTTGQQWGEHRNMDMLFVLGMATGQVKSVFPRPFWGILPGGVPYYIIDTTGKWVGYQETDNASAQP